MASAASAAAEYVNALDISYGSALVPRFSRLLGPAGVVNLAPEGAAVPSYLWLSRSSDEAIVELAILYGDEALPAHFTRKTRAVSGTGEPVFIAYRTAAVSGSEKPVTTVHLLKSGDPESASRESLTEAGRSLALSLELLLDEPAFWLSPISSARGRASPRAPPKREALAFSLSHSRMPRISLAPIASLLFIAPIHPSLSAITRLCIRSRGEPRFRALAVPQRRRAPPRR